MLRLYFAIFLAVLSGLSSVSHAQHMHQNMHQMDNNGNMIHDEVTMPGLRGLDATKEESLELEIMFRNFRSLSRSVENLPNGIKTITTSDDPKTMEALVSHVAGMITRVEEKRDPQIFIQSPTLDIFFERGDAIETDIEISEAGVIVIQTSEDPDVVAALHIHAAEVTDMVDRGMMAVHEKMMEHHHGSN